MCLITIGSLLVVVMKLISLSFDIDASIPLSEKKSPPSTSHLPDFISYLSYSIFPATTIFGPYTTYDEHLKYTAGVKMVCMYVHTTSMYMYMCTKYIPKLHMYVRTCVHSYVQT